MGEALPNDAEENELEATEIIHPLTVVEPERLFINVP
jgi:hypothetical protein